MTTEEIKQTIRRFLAEQGAKEFWINSCIAWMIRVLVTNQYFVTDIKSPVCTIKSGCISTFKCQATASAPDIDKTLIATLEYNFHPVNGHKVTFTPLK